MSNLILTRRVKERVIITSPEGVVLTVTLVDFRNATTVRLGFECPRDWTVNREEIQQRIDSAKLPPPSTFDVGEPLPEDSWNRVIEVIEQETRDGE